MSTTDWPALVTAALRVEYPRLPDPLPAPVADLVGVLADRAATAQPGVTSQMVGAYSVTYAQGGQAVPLTAMEAMLLRPWHRATTKSVPMRSTILEGDDDEPRVIDDTDEDRGWRRIAVR